MDDEAINEDILIACADLVGRTGATGFNISYTLDDDPPQWWAEAMYRGARLTSGLRPTPTSAALGLALRILRGAQCRCGRLVSLSDGATSAGTIDGCRWRLMGSRWEPGCDASPLSQEEAARVRERLHKGQNDGRKGHS